MTIVVERAAGDWFYASYPALQVVSQGPTEAEALKNLAEALVEFFVSCAARGTVEEVMREAGLLPPRAELPVPTDDYLDEILVP